MRQENFCETEIPEDFAKEARIQNNNTFPNILCAPIILKITFTLYITHTYVFFLSSSFSHFTQKFRTESYRDVLESHKRSIVIYISVCDTPFRSISLRNGILGTSILHLKFSPFQRKLPSGFSPKSQNESPFSKKDLSRTTYGKLRSELTNFTQLIINGSTNLPNVCKINEKKKKQIFDNYILQF